MKIVTGYTGSEHITSNDDQALRQGIFGKGSYVLNVGNKFEATLTDANTVQIQDGEGVLQGVHFRVLPGTVDTVNIENGTTGYNRIDLIVARYTKDAVTGIESVNWAVITGTPSASTPTAPEYTEGDILAGDTLAEFPLYKVELSGLTPQMWPMFDPHTGSVGGIAAEPPFMNNKTISGNGTIKSDNTIILKGGHTYLLRLEWNIQPSGNTDFSLTMTVNKKDTNENYLIAIPTKYTTLGSDTTFYYFEADTEIEIKATGYTNMPQLDVSCGLSILQIA